MAGIRLKTAKVCPTCGESFRPWQSTQRCCSRACSDEDKRARGVTRTPESRARMSAQRRGPENPGFKHGRRAGVRDRVGERVFRDGDECRAPWCPGGYQRVAQHHVIYRQEIVRLGGDVWDARNALSLCTSCHLRHHNRVEGYVLPITLLRDETIAFADELLGPAGALEYLTRRYSGSDPRLAMRVVTGAVRATEEEFAAAIGLLSELAVTPASDVEGDDLREERWEP